MEDHTEAKPAKRQKRDRLDVDSVLEQQHPPPPPPGPPGAPYPPDSTLHQTRPPFADQATSRQPIQGPLPPQSYQAPQQQPLPQGATLPIPLGTLPPLSNPAGTVGPSGGQRTNLEYRDSQDSKVRPGYHDQRPPGPGYGPSVTHQTRSFSDYGQVPGAYTSVGPSPPPSIPPEHHRRSVAGHEVPQHNTIQGPPAMAEQHGAYPPPPPQVVQHGGPPPMNNGYAVMSSSAPPIAPPHDPYGGGQYGQPPSHPQTPIAPSNPPVYYQQPQSYQSYSTHIKKKTVRATQACNECRQRKQRCDEERPCTFCRENDKTCEYKDVPASKTDRTMSDLRDDIKSVDRGVKELGPRIANIEAHLTRGLPMGSLAKPEPVDTDETMQVGDREFEENEGTLTDLERLLDGIRQESVRKYKRFREENEETRREIERLKEALAVEKSLRHQSDDQVDTNHTTGVRDLTKWPFIKQLFDRAGVTNPNYVWQLERNRGLLRIYGQGEGSDLGDGAHDREDYPTPVSNAASPRYHLEDAGSNASSPQDGIWGYGSSTPMSRSTSEYAHASQTGEGGLLPHGRLNLNAGEVFRLVGSYYRHMHIMHPFLDPHRLNKMIEAFTLKYSYGTQPAVDRSPAVERSSPATPFAMPAVPQQSGHHVSNAFKTANQNNKRKWDTSFAGPVESDEIPRSQSPKLEHHISNAIVLLVLAIGKICEHQAALPPVVPSSRKQSNQQNHGDAMSVASPTPSNISISSILSPINDPRTLGGSPRTSNSTVDGRPLKNADVIPGLAYYAKASDFLGNVNGGTDVSHGQAKLLAGLYMGQLGRAKESWKWIQEACVISRILIAEALEAKRNENLPGPLYPPGPIHTETHKKKIQLLFWSCLLSESDIRAEFGDLPDSGLSQYEDDSIVEYPAASTESGVLPPDIDVTGIGMHFMAQIYVRKRLNNIHRTLYMPNKEFHPLVHMASIQEWHESLHPRIKFNSEDEGSARDVNDARLRGKYFGGLYIIARPLLHQAIHFMPGAVMPDNWQQIERSIRNNDKNPNLEDLIAACKLCIWAALRSTTAFDGLTDENFSRRWILPNITGTVTAQFGNMLVLTAAYKSWLQPLIDKDELTRLLRRTIKHQLTLRHILPYMELNVKVLKQAYREVTGRDYNEPMSAHTSFVMA